MEEKEKSLEILLYEIENKAKILKKTEGGRLIVLFKANEAPTLMKNVGIARNIAFKNEGAGVLNEFGSDIDDSDQYYDQLITWDDKVKAIIAGYRIQKLAALPSFHQSPLFHFFDFSDEFKRDYAPYTVELGRAFILPQHQGKTALDQLFEAIGCWINKDKKLKYLIGKLTLYPKDVKGNPKDLSVIYEFIEMYLKADKQLITPRAEFALDKSTTKKSGELTGNITRDLRIILMKHNAPPLLSVYVKLASELSISGSGFLTNLKAYGTVFHEHFGKTEETALMAPLEGIRPDIKERYLSGFLKPA